MSETVLLGPRGRGSTGARGIVPRGRPILRGAFGTEHRGRCEERVPSSEMKRLLWSLFPLGFRPFFPSGTGKPTRVLIDFTLVCCVTASNDNWYEGEGQKRRTPAFKSALVSAIEPRNDRCDHGGGRRVVSPPPPLLTQTIPIPPFPSGLDDRYVAL